MRFSSLSLVLFSGLSIAVGCGGGATDGPDGAGGSPTGTGGAWLGIGGTGPAGSGGASGGAWSAGGQVGIGGTPGGGGLPGVGGGASGGAAAGGSGSGGAPSSGGSGSGGDLADFDCDTPMPTSGAQQHTNNGRGGEGNLAWEIWSNTGSGNLTTYSVPAFTASWNNSGGYLGRLGYEWGGFGDTPLPHDQYGTISAQVSSKKSGSAGSYSYIGIYGWSNNPCVEWYIVDDNFGTMPFNPGGTVNKGEVDIDGGTYIMYTRDTTGTGGSRCSGASNWIQYYSMRKSARSCGLISITEHFEAWESLGMNLGDLLEAKILAEVGGGVGSVDFPVANVILTP